MIQNKIKNKNLYKIKNSNKMQKTIRYNTTQLNDKKYEINFNKI